MRIRGNFRDAMSSKPVDEGVYGCEIEGAEDKEGAKANYLKWTLVITDDEEKGRKLFHNTPYDGAGAGMFADFWSKASGEELDIDELDELDFDIDDVLGNPLVVTVIHEEYPEGSGKMVAKVDRISASEKKAPKKKKGRK